MAKKVVATLKTGQSKSLAKVIKMVKSSKSGAYTFEESLLPSEQVKDFLSKK